MSRSRVAAIILLPGLLCAVACRQDMHNQPRYKPLASTEFFDDGRSARPAIDDTVARAAVDRCGNARGGVPSPFLDVPIARYEAHSTPGPVCALAGREAPLPYEVLANRYGDLQSYLAEFTISLDEIIRAGFLLEDDRAAILEAQAAKAQAAFA